MASAICSCGLIKAHNAGLKVIDGVEHCTICGLPLEQPRSAPGTSAQHEAVVVAINVAPPATRGTLWSLIIGGVGDQILSALLVGAAAADDETSLALIGWLVISVGSSLMLVGLVAFGVVLGSHVYRNERP